MQLALDQEEYGWLEILSPVHLGGGQGCQYFFFYTSKTSFDIIYIFLLLFKIYLLILYYKIILYHFYNRLIIFQLIFLLLIILNFHSVFLWFHFWLPPLKVPSQAGEGPPWPLGGVVWGGWMSFVANISAILYPVCSKNCSWAITLACHRLIFDVLHCNKSISVIYILCDLKL